MQFAHDDEGSLVAVKFRRSFGRGAVGGSLA